VIRLNFKTYPPRFEGDVEQYGATVSGQYYEIPKALRTYLSFAGLKEMSDGSEDIEVWAAPKSPVGHPEYLALVLSRRFDVTLTKDAAKTLKAIEARPMPRAQEDQHNLFATPEPQGWPRTPGGTAELKIQVAGDYFYANCDEGDRPREALLRSAGWFPCRPATEKGRQTMGTRPWRTADAFLADALKELMSPNARKKLKLISTEAARRIKSSSAKAVPANFSVPTPADLDYLDFQKAGVHETLSRGENVIIADEMGLGKTIQGIGIINGRPDAKRILVIPQANMRIGWMREIAKWQTQERTIGIVEGKDFPETDIVIINFDILDAHAEMLHSIDWDLILIDEAQNAANPEAKRTQVIDGVLVDPADLDAEPVPDHLQTPLKLAPGGISVQLTGTPIPSKVHQLYAIASRAAPKIFGTGAEGRQAFLDRYSPMVPIRIDRYGKKVVMWVPDRARNLEELQLRLRGSCMVRRLKRDVDLPPKFRQLIEMPIQLTNRDMAILRQAEADLTEIHERIGGARFEGRPEELANVVIDTCANLGTTTAGFAEISRIRKNLGILKAPYVADFIREELRADMHMAPADRRKTICFAYHKDVIDIIAAGIEDEFPGSVAIYNGATSKKARQKAVDDFQQDDKTRVFIGSGAAATGLTLIRSNRVRMAEMDWRPMTMIQEEDRAWRIGQELSVHVGYLAIPNTLDARMGNSILEKMEVAEAATSTVKLRSEALPRHTQFELETFDGEMAAAELASLDYAEMEIG
jgi:hypothetical protein